MVNVDLIPKHLNSEIQEDMDSFSTFLNPQLVRLQKQFMQSSKEKSKVSDEGGISQVVNKELSPKEIHKQIQRLQQGDTSNSEMHFQQKQFQKSVAPSMVA